jgi:hypothetical protein
MYQGDHFALASPIRTCVAPLSSGVRHQTIELLSFLRKQARESTVWQLKSEMFAPAKLMKDRQRALAQAAHWLKKELQALSCARNV